MHGWRMRIEMIGIVVLAALVLVVTPLTYATTSMVMTEGYIKGYHDGFRDFGNNGWRPECPT
jgi:hypothetical protein